MKKEDLFWMVSQLDETDVETWTISSWLEVCMEETQRRKCSPELLEMLTKADDAYSEAINYLRRAKLLLMNEIEDEKNDK